jgi:hypothetical protein
MRPWERRISRMIRESSMHYHPHRFLHIHGVFSKALYRKILEAIPPPDMYNNKYMNSTSCSMPTNVCYKLPDLLNELTEFLQSRDFVSTIVRRFCADSTPDEILQLRAGRSLSYLHKDFAGYSDESDVDKSAALISYRFNFARDYLHAHWGDWVLAQGVGRNREKTVLMPYLPNTFLAYRILPESCHRVELSSTGIVTARDTLQGYIFQSDKELPSSFSHYAEFHGI